MKKEIKMRTKILVGVFAVVLIATTIIGVFLKKALAAEQGVYLLSYRAGAYDMFPENDGSISVMIDGKKYYYSDDFDDGEIATKISKMENQNVVYELHDNKIVKVYTMDEVLSQEVTVEPSVRDGLIYRKGKFSQKSFELVVKVSNNLQGDFKENDLLWGLSETEKDCLYSTLKKLEIEPSDKVDFGSSGWWMWKEYDKTISENVNDVIKAEETKEYKYTVNLHNDGVINQKKYNIILYATPTFDTGVGRRVEGKIQVGNLDYQEEKTEEKKAISNTGQSVAQAANTLDGIQNAIQFSKDLFSAAQLDQINEFVNMWMSELLLAKYVEKSDLKEKVSEKIANELLKKLGLDTSVLAIPGEIRATTYLETQIKDGSKVFIQFNIDLINFDFGNSGMPTMATGSGTAIVYNMDGEELNSSVILPVYANVCAFCEQLQQVAKDTIFNGAKEYLGIFGISAESTAEAMSSQIMAKVLNNKYTKDVFKMVDAKDVKKALKKIIVDGEKTVNKKIFKLITTPSQGSTEVSVKCPVDVKIYDNDGNLCGVVKDNTVDSTYDDIFVNVVGEQKNIYLVGDDYSFVMTGTDEGSMDYVVREFDDEGNTTREIAYENIKLSNGCKYYSYVPEAVNHSSTLFDLTDQEGRIILPTIGEDIDINISINGVCGENLRWTLSDAGLLRIYGSGKMYDYDYYANSSKAPWYLSENKEKIKRVEIVQGVESIGAHAFWGLSNLEMVDIPNSIIEVGKNIFYGCPLLKSAGSIEGEFNIQFNWQEEIPDNAFSGCSSLSSVSIPSSIKSMGKYVFYGCDSLKTAGLKGDCNIQFGWEKKIPDNAFYGCSGLESIDIPETVTTIGSYSFYQSGLKNIKLEKNILEIGGSAFSGCSNLENIYYDIIRLEEDRKAEYTYTETIFSYAGTDTLGVSVIIGDDVIDIPDYIFCQNGNNIKILEIGKNVEYIGLNAFSGSSIQKIFYNAKNVLHYPKTNFTGGPFWNCSDEKGLELIIGDDVECIPQNIFRSNKSGYSRLVSDFHCNKITIGKNVREINGSFCGFEDLKSFNVSTENKYYSVENGVLYDKGKTRIICYPASKQDNIYEAPDTLVCIGEEAFENCEKITEIVLNSGVQTIEYMAFCECNNLNFIQIPESVVKIEQYAFIECDKLKTLGPIGGDYNIQCGAMLEIPDNAFSSCEELTSIVIPKGVSAIGKSAFSGCEVLTSVEMQEGLTIIGDEAFAECNKLSMIVMPKGVREIGKEAFLGCVSLESIEMLDGLTTINDYAFSYCTKLEKIVIPESVKKIGQDVFYRTLWLTNEQTKNSVIILGHILLDGRRYCENNYIVPKEVTIINDGAFEDCYHLNSISLPEGVKVIGRWAFENCNFQTITIPDSVTEIGKYAFYGNWNLEKIYMGGNAPMNVDKDAFVNFRGDVYILPYAEGYNVEPWIRYNLIVINDTEDPNSTMQPSSSLSSSGTTEPNVVKMQTIPKVGTLISDTKSNAEYKVVTYGKSVEFSRIINKNVTKMTIPSTVTISGVTYKVSGIAEKAFNGCLKLKSVTIGKSITSIGNKAFFKCTELARLTIPINVTKIGKQAFYKCNKLKKIIIKTNKLTAKNVGSKAFGGIHKKAVVKVPVKKMKVYKTLLKKKGITGKNQKIS